MEHEEKKSTFPVEEKLKAIEAIASDLESGKLTLEESLKAFEEGVKLVRETNEYLTSVEEKIRVLTGEDAQ